MIQSWVPRKMLSDLGKRPECSGWAQEHGEGLGWNFWGEFFLSRKTWWEAHQPWISSLYPSTNSSSESLAKCASLQQALCPLSSVWRVLSWLSEQFTAKPLRMGSGDLSSPAFTLTPLAALSSPPALPEPGLASLFSVFWDVPSAPARERSDHTRWGAACLDSFPWRQICQGRGQRIDFQFDPESISLTCCMMFWRERKLHDSAWCPMTKRGTLRENCSHLLSSKWKASNPNQPVLPIFTHPWAGEVA